VAAHEDEMLRYGTKLLSDVPGLRLVGTAPRKASVLSFVLEGVHPHDIGTILDFQGVAIRTGQHCAEPVMQHFGIPASARASFAIYNTFEDVEAFLAGLREVVKVMG
jgi:cysteine desulfurase/selenocysteine lyase